LKKEVYEEEKSNDKDDDKGDESGELVPVIGEEGGERII